MVNLPHETEALAQRLAERKRLTVEDAIRVALEDQVRREEMLSGQRPRDQSAEAVSSRRARTDKFIADLAAMPVLDPRSPHEIMDDLNSL